MRTAIALAAVSILGGAVLSGTAMRQPPSGRASIGYISPKRLLTESPEARSGAARYQAKAKSASAELKTLRAALEATRKELAQAKDGASQEELRRRERQQQASLEQATAEAQKELKESQRELVGDLNELLRPTIAEVAKERNIEVILNGDTGVIWASPALDLTPAVVARLKEKAANAEKP